MRWRDMRFEQPAEIGCKVVFRDRVGNVWMSNWTKARDHIIAWMPISELQQPDLPGEIPDGWRAVDKAVDARSLSKSAKKWNTVSGAWDVIDPGYSSNWDSSPKAYYIVPIDPPAPQYRPFASWQEWWPHHGRWYRDADGHICTAWLDVIEAAADFAAGAVFLNADGTDAEPFGMKIE
jgi:hypothetical protein